jgi:hypothetical protein
MTRVGSGLDLGRFHTVENLDYPMKYRYHTGQTTADGWHFKMSRWINPDDNGLQFQSSISRVACGADMARY